MENMGKSMFTCFMACPFCVLCARQLSVTEGFPDHCSMEWLYSKLGVSVIIRQTAAGYGILSKFHFLPPAPAAQQLSAVGFLFSYKYKKEPLSRCVMFWIIKNKNSLVCVSEICSSDSCPNEQSYSYLQSNIVTE